MARFAQPWLAMNVRGVMRGGLRSVRADESIAAALRIMIDAEIGVLLVSGTGDGRFAIVSKTDVLEHVAAHGGLEGDVGTIATSGVLTVDADAPVSHALRAMAEEGVHHVIALDRGEPVGVLGAWDLVRAVGEGRISLQEGPARAVGARSGPGV